MEYDIEWLLHDYGNFLVKYGLDDKSIRLHFNEWKQKSGTDSAKDYLWYLFQVILGETGKQIINSSDLQKNNLEIYQAMWFFRTHVEGENGNDVKQLINETRIRLWETELPCLFQVKIVASHCCDYCDKLNGMHIEPAGILQHESFNLKHCTNEEGCNCWIGPEVVRDGNDQIVMKQK